MIDSGEIPFGGWLFLNNRPWSFAASGRILHLFYLSFNIKWYGQSKQGNLISIAEFAGW